MDSSTNPGLVWVEAISAVSFISSKKLIELEKLDVDLLNVIGDNDNDYQMLKAFKGGIIKVHKFIIRTT